MADSLAGQLRGALGPEAVVDDPELLVAYETDWMGRRPGRARLAARPAATGEVVQVVDACRRAGAAVVPQGGNTGLVGGGVPRDGEVVLTTRRLDWVGDVDPLTATLAAGAGAPLAVVRDRARAAGFDLGVDLGARDSATVGGMAATNAGGLRVIRHGHMRAHLAGLEAVTAGGQVVSRMAGLVKDTAGYDLTGLLCGSEGTLAVITAVLLRLVPATPARVTAVAGLASLDRAMAVLAVLRRRLPELEAAEVVLADGVRLVGELFGVTPAVDRSWPCQLLVEVAGADDAPLLDRLADALDAAGLSAEDSDTAVATDPGGRTALWEVRERHPEVVGRVGVPHKLDVSLPLGRLAAFEQEVRARLAAAAPGATPVLFGHAGDGGLHVNVAMPAGEPDRAERIDEVVLELVGAMGGSVSAEHGIGTDKVRWVGLTRGPAELAA
ncbi:MAG TPA: FAD-binding oxidoreductase, partial [Acidimicrobiales bacterium]|nr:FAD-binding oxidoreductase [Acidimicrobiales bacterium]